MALSSPQQQVANSPARFRVLVSGRRFGKTYLAIRELAKFAVRGQALRQRCWYVAPSYRMAKQIAWLMLKEKLIYHRWVRAFNEQDLTATLKNGSTISLRGADNYDSLRGVGLDFLVMDEFADIKREAWQEVLRPTLSDTGGHALFTGTPKGRNWAYDLFMKGQEEDPAWASWQFTTLDGGMVPLEEIESAREELDDLTFNQEYLADFTNFEGRAYYPFLISTHCAPLKYDPKQPLIFCFDFNVAPGVAAVCQEQILPSGHEGTGVIGEVCIPRNSNTPAVCRRLVQDWGKHEGIIKVYGDSTGGSRGSAKVSGSDWDLIREEFKGPFGSRIYYRVPKANPAERARINAVNSRLLSHSGMIRLMVDPAKAPHVVKDFEGVRLLEGGDGSLDKKADPELSHISDAIGYMCHVEFPTTKLTSTSQEFLI
jgi:hypothetical protein